MMAASKPEAAAAASLIQRDIFMTAPPRTDKKPTGDTIAPTRDTIAPTRI
jgi:hypothetical protein